MRPRRRIPLMRIGLAEDLAEGLDGEEEVEEEEDWETVTGLVAVSNGLLIFLIRLSEIV
jgi:hypothetical protein